VEGRVVEKLTHFFLAFVSRMKGIHESQLCNGGKIKAKMHKETVARDGSAKVLPQSTIRAHKKKGWAACQRF
jgi:hypothetical protein